MSEPESPFSSDQPPAEECALDGLLADLLNHWQDDEPALSASEGEDSPTEAPVEFDAAPVEQTLALLAGLPAQEGAPVGGTASEIEPPPPEAEPPAEAPVEVDVTPLEQGCALPAPLPALELAPAEESLGEPEPPPAPEPRRSPVTTVPSKTEALLELVRAIYRNLEQARLAAGDAPGQKQGRDGYVVVRLGADYYAIPIRQVLETDRLPRCTRLPGVPGFVRGVTNLRGQILPLLDLRLWMGIGGPELAEGRMVVVRGSDGAASGLVVDGLAGIAWIARQELAPVPSDDRGKLGRLLAGVGQHRQRPVGVLDLDRLFASEELEELRPV